MLKTTKRDIVFSEGETVSISCNVNMGLGVRYLCSSSEILYDNGVMA